MWRPTEVHVLNATPKPTLVADDALPTVKAIAEAFAAEADAYKAGAYKNCGIEEAILTLLGGSPMSAERAERAERELREEYAAAKTPSEAAFLRGVAAGRGYEWGVAEQAEAHPAPLSMPDDETISGIITAGDEAMWGAVYPKTDPALRDAATVDADYRRGTAEQRRIMAAWNNRVRTAHAAGARAALARRPRCTRHRTRRRAVARSSGSRGDPGGGEPDLPEPPRRRFESDVTRPERWAA